MKTNIILVIIIAALAYLGTLYFETSTPRGLTIAPVSPIEDTTAQTAPDFTFKDANGKTHKLSDFKGKTILLNFWASWCPPCIKELPLLSQAAAEEDVILIALSSDIDEKSMKAFLKKNKIDSQTKNIYFAWDKNGTVTQNTFQTFRLPETILIDDSLAMRSKIIGADWNYQDLAAKISAIKN